MLKQELDAIEKAMKGGDLKELEKRLTDFSGQGLGSAQQLFTAEFGDKLGQRLGQAIIDIQTGKLEGGGLAPNFMENLFKAQGIDKSAERKELRAEQANLRKTINLLNDEFDRMAKETSTATITNEVKRLKEGIDKAAESFIGVDNYVRAQTEAANQTAKLIEDNAKFVIEQKGVMNSIIANIQELQRELTRLNSK